MENSRMIETLPDEITISILLLLLPQVLSKYKGISRIWNSVISSKWFVEAHLFNMKAGNNFSLIHRYHVASPPICYELKLWKGDNIVYRQLPRNCEESEVLGSYNGLVLFCNTKDQYTIKNPTTKKYIIVPNLPISFPKGHDVAWVYFGFGYVKNSNDYIIMRIAYLWAETGGVTQVNIFSRNSNSWSKLSSFPFDTYPCANAFFVGNLFHWNLCFGCGVYKLATYDIESGIYSLIQIPKFKYHPLNLQVQGLDDNTIAVYCSRLREVEGRFYSKFFFQMHILHYAKEGPTWTTIMIFTKTLVPNKYHICPISFLNVDRTKILFIVQPWGDYYCYDTISKTFQLSEEYEMTYGVQHAFKYTQSLVSPVAC